MMCSVETVRAGHRFVCTLPAPHNDEPCVFWLGAPLAAPAPLWTADNLTDHEADA